MRLSVCVAVVCVVSEVERGRKFPVVLGGMFIDFQRLMYSGDGGVGNSA